MEATIGLSEVTVTLAAEVRTAPTSPQTRVEFPSGYSNFSSCSDRL